MDDKQGKDMSVRTLVAVGLRFLAVALFFFAFTTAVYTGALRMHGPEGMAPGLALVFAATLALGVVLWAAARPLSGFFLAGLPREQAGTLTVANLVTAGCALMSLWWLKGALVGLLDVWLRAQLLAEVSGRSAWASLDGNTQAAAIARLFELIVGLLVLAKAQQIGHWVMRAPAIEAADSA